MASVYKKGKTWYLSFKDSTGRWRNKASRAANKTEAARLARELERAAERERLGVDGPQRVKDDGSTLAQLLTWWLENYSIGKPSHSIDLSFLKKHVMSSDLGALPMASLTAGQIHVFLQGKARTLKPRSINHLRGYIGRAVNAAIKAERYEGENPVRNVAKWRVPRGTHDFLRHHEVRPVLDNVPARWRPIMAVAIYTGLRKGELLGLRKRDVDLGSRLLTVARSYDRDTTKGGHADVIPIAEEAVSFLMQALATTTSQLVFPDAHGEMLSPHTPLEDVLRRALAHAGIVESYSHICRRKGCGYTKASMSSDLLHCPHDGRKLWPKPIVRRIRFHDLRHTTASLLFMKGANPAAVQRIMRHADPAITTEVYGHMAPGYLKAEVDRLTFNPTTFEHSSEPLPVAACGSNSFSTPFLPAADGALLGGDGGGQKDQGLQVDALVGVKGFEPSASWSRTNGSDRPARRGQSQPYANATGSGDSPVQMSQPRATDAKSFSTRVLPEPGTSHTQLSVMGPPLLTVVEAAAELGVSRATVYKLCARGGLRHVRVSNSIRITRQAIFDLVASRASTR